MKILLKKIFSEAYVLHSAFPEHLWMPDNPAHLWEEVTMKKNWDPSQAKSLSCHNPFAFHHHCTNFCRMARAGDSKRWPQGLLPSHGSHWTDGGNSVKGTKLLPGFLLSSLDDILPVISSSFGCPSLSMSPDEVTHSVPAGVRQVMREGGGQVEPAYWPSGENATAQAPTRMLFHKGEHSICPIF